MKITRSVLFDKDVKKLNEKELLELLDKAISLFTTDKQHPSLHTKHITCRQEKNLYSFRVNKNYRVLFIDYRTHIELYRLLNHSKYDRLTKRC